MIYIPTKLESKPKDCNHCPYNNMFNTVAEAIKHKISCGYCYEDCPLMEDKELSRLRAIIGGLEEECPYCKGNLIGNLVAKQEMNKEAGK